MSVKGEEIAMSDSRTCLRDFIPIKINGKSYGRLWHHHDITERKQAEEQLRKTLESIGDGFIALDTDWRFIYLNTSAERIVGFGRDEALGKIFWDIFPKTIGTNLEREYRRAMAGEATIFESFYEPWGRWYHNRCYPREGGGISVYFEDITERKRVEEALNKSERKFRSIVENSEAGISLIDDCGNIVEWNASQEYITGLKREDVIGKPAWDIKFQLIPQEQRTQEAYEKLKSFLLRLTDKGRTALKGWIDDQEIQRSDGRRKTIHEVIFPIKTDKGYNIGLITHDITERMETEKSLRIKDEAIESALNAMSLASPSGDLFYANESWLKMMGYEREEIEGRSLKDFSQNLEAADEIAKQISATGRWEGELAARKKDGSSMDVHLSASAVNDKSDRTICIISSFIDISVSKKAQRELEESKNKLKAIFDLVPIGIYVGDKKAKFIEANPYFLDFMGLSLEELNQRKHWERRYFSADGDLLPKPTENSFSFLPAHKPINEGKPSKGIEIGMEKENGEIVWTRANAVPTHFSDWSVIVAMLDITDRRKMEKELREREERFRKIFDLSPIGIQLFDAESFLVSANQTSQKIIDKIDTARQKRHNLFRDVLADVEGQHRLMSGQIVNEGRWVNAKFGKTARPDKPDKDMLSNRKGQIYIENIVAVLGEASDPDGYLCIQQDLTEHRLADEAVISENERLQIIYDIWKTRVKTSDMRLHDYQE